MESIKMVFVLAFVTLAFLVQGKRVTNSVRVHFLHHSTGKIIYYGGKEENADIPSLFQKYNESNHVSYSISEQYFPKSKPYGWNNYPFDYYNVWVKNAGNVAFMEEPTLEILTKEFDVIIFKHCFPVSQVLEGNNLPNIDSKEKTLDNYKFQYGALREKMLQIPETKFLIWTGAALTKESTTEENARRSQAFFHWVKTEWDKPNDNIFIWDFFEIETEGGIYLKTEYAAGPTDSHPNQNFARKANRLFFQRIIDVIENQGEKTSLTGEIKKSL